MYTNQSVFYKAVLVLIIVIQIIQQQVVMGQLGEPADLDDETLELDHGSTEDAPNIGHISTTARPNNSVKPHHRVHHRSQTVEASNNTTTTTTTTPPNNNNTSNDNSTIGGDATQSDDAPELPSDCGFVPLKGQAAGRSLRGSVNRIAGGYDANENDYPSFVYVKSDYAGYRLSESCGGVIINDRYVLTAAHCTDAAVSISVTPTKRRFHSEPVLSADKWCTAPGYTGHDQLDYDFALIRLKEPLKFGDKIQPACLAKKLVRLGTRADSVGLGLTNLGDYGDQTRADVLQVLPVAKVKCAPLDLAPYRMCFRSHDNRYKGDSCAGDSGGPIYITIKGRQTVFGITSYGPEVCKKGEVNTSINTDVAAVRTEILKLMRNC